MNDADTDDRASHRLISSRMVEGTPVFDRSGERLGKLHSVMIDKVTGQVAYAVLAFGGVLHMGEHVHPVPWEKLAYSPDRRGYVVEISRETLENAPIMTLDQADRPRTAAEEETLEEAFKAYYFPVW